METEPIIEIIETNDIQPVLTPRLRRSEYGRIYTIQHNWNEFADIRTIDTQIDNLFEQMVQEQVNSAGENDIVNISINHDNLETPLYITNARKKNVRYEKFCNQIYNMEQSSRLSGFLSSGQLEVKVVVIKSVTGGKRGNRAPRSAKTDIRLKRSVVEIRTFGENTNACFFNALAVACYYKNHLDHPNKRTLFQKMRENTGKIQEKLAKEIASKCRIPYNTSISINEFDIIQRQLEYRLIVVCAFTDSPIYRGKLGNTKEIVCLCFYEDNYSDGHFSAITDLRKYMRGKIDFCVDCWTRVAKPGQHRCSSTCSVCYRTDCYSVTETRGQFLCPICNIFCQTISCYSSHFKRCRQQEVCNVCKCTFRQRDNHVCFEYVCQKCSQRYTESPHYCFVPVISLQKLQEEDRQRNVTVCFDIESMFRKMNASPTTLEHIPILLVAKIRCSKITSVHNFCDENDSLCDICPHEYLTYHGQSCINEFCDFIFNILSKRAEQAKAFVTIYAHNFRYV